MHSPVHEEAVPHTIESDVWEAIWNADVTALNHLVENHTEEIVNLQENGGWTPLHYAAGWGQEQLVSILLGLIDDVNARDDDGQTALHWAVKGGSVPAIGCLEAHGTGYPQERGRRSNIPVVSLLLEANARHLSDHQGRKPLHLAAIEGRSDVVLRLVADPECDPSCLDKDGLSAAELAEKELTTKRDAILRILGPAERNIMREKLEVALNEKDQIEDSLSRKIQTSSRILAGSWFSVVVGGLAVLAYWYNVVDLVEDFMKS